MMNELKYQKYIKIYDFFFLLLTFFRIFYFTNEFKKNENSYICKYKLN